MPVQMRPTADGPPASPALP